jgi:hypothetical protein
VRGIIATALALPVLGLAQLEVLVRRSIIGQMAAVGVATVLIVGGLMVFLPGRSASAFPATKFDPRAPSAINPTITSDMALDAPVQIQFTKPMDGISVAATLQIEPMASVDLKWDASGEILSLVPKPFWGAYTYYTVEIGASARDRNGLTLGQPVHTMFLTGPLTSATITPTVTVGKEMSPTTGFQIAFTRPVKLDTVIARFGISPVVQGAMTGDDPTDTASQVFTFTPSQPLAPGTSYTVTFFDELARDAKGVQILPVTPLTAKTVSGPAVVRFRPRDKSTGVATDQVVSVRFTTAMDTESTAAAFSLKVNGKPVEGKIEWAERNTVLVFTPTSVFPIGAKVVAAVADTALGANGMKLQAASSGTFTVVKPYITKGKNGGVIIGTAPWATAEKFVLSMINCTRTGGWIISSGACSSYGHHTLPAQPKLFMDSGIQARVARPFAKYLADHNVLLHLADGTVRSRFIRGGYTSPTFGENIGAPRSLTSGLISEHMFFQNEYPCECEHYLNIMYPRFDRVGVGIWITNGRIRMVSNFYHP